MKRREASTDWMILIGFLLVLVVLAIVYFVTRNEKIKAKRNVYRESIAQLKKQIEMQEGVVMSLVNQLDLFRERKDLITRKAIRFFRVIKILAITLILVLAGGVYSILEMKFWECVLLIAASMGLIYKAICIVLRNAIGNFNDLLNFCQNYIIEWQFNRKGFETAYISTLEDKLYQEQVYLEQLKTQYSKMTNDNSA